MPLLTPTAPATLSALREHALASEAPPHAVDELLMALSRPVWPGEDVHGRARQLQLILEEARFAGVQGSDGRQVLSVAAQALLRLGEPYASRLPEAGRRALREAPPPPLHAHLDEDEEAAEVRFSPGTRVLLGLAFAWGLYEVTATASLASTSLIALGICLGFTGITLFVPWFYLMQSPTARRGTARTFCMVVTVLSLSGMLMLLPISLFLNSGSWRETEGLSSFSRWVLGGLVVRVGLLLALGRARFRPD